MGACGGVGWGHQFSCVLRNAQSASGRTTILVVGELNSRAENPFILVVGKLGSRLFG